MVCSLSSASIHYSINLLCFPNRQYSFTFLPHACQRQKLLYEQTGQANLNFFPPQQYPPMGFKDKKSRNKKKYICHTLDVEWVVDDKDPIPHHREVHWQVTDVTSLIVILKQTEIQKDMGLEVKLLM